MEQRMKARRLQSTDFDLQTIYHSTSSTLVICSFVGSKWYHHTFQQFWAAAISVSIRADFHAQYLSYFKYSGYCACCMLRHDRFQLRPTRRWKEYEKTWQRNPTIKDWQKERFSITWETRYSISVSSDSNAIVCQVPCLLPLNPPSDQSRLASLKWWSSLTHVLSARFGADCPVVVKP
jgi:hypothetical protein